MKFTINLEAADEGFIKNFKENRAARKKEKGRRYNMPNQTFSGVDEALAYAKTIYVGDNWPYYLEMELKNAETFVISIGRWKDNRASVQNIQTAVTKAQANWKRVLKAVAEDYYDTNTDESIDKKKTSKTQFVASLNFGAMSIDLRSSGETVVEYEFYSKFIYNGHLVEEMNELGDFNGKVLPELRD